MRKYFLYISLWCFLTLIILSSFVNFSFNIYNIVILGNEKSNSSWLSNVNYLSSRLYPDVQSALLLPNDIYAFPQRDEIACFVMSAPKNRLARNAIRRTWGRKIRPLFVIGKSDNKTYSRVLTEANAYDDIIVEDFIDSFNNLTIKTAFAMKHFVMHFNHSIYFFKVDDDVLVHLSNLYKFLNDENLPENAIIVRFEMSKTKYLRKRSEFIFQQYQNSYEIQPDFIDEPAYLIPGHMVEKVYMTLINFPLFTLEDVILRIKMTQTLNYNLHSNKKFQTRHFLPFSIPCSHEHFITIHSIKASDMIIRWERLRKPYSCNLFDKFMAYLV